MRVAIIIATVRIPALSLEGVEKVFYTLCFGIKKHHLKVFTRYYSVDMLVLSNTESLNSSAAHFKLASHFPSVAESRSVQ